MKKIVLMAACAMLVSCTDVEGAISALNAQGLQPVQVGGYSFFGCSDKDTFSTKFVAKNANGKMVSGKVCSGLFKGKTIRFD